MHGTASPTGDTYGHSFAEETIQLALHISFEWLKSLVAGAKSAVIVNRYARE
jgi:hypothetical protein